VLFTTVNRSSTTSRGASLSGDGAIGRAIEWSGSVTWIDLDSDVPLRGRPNWYGHARIAWRPVPALRLGAAMDFNSDFLETSVPTGVVRLDGHVAFDLFADWRVVAPLSVSLALRNVAGARWQDAVGFPAPGRVLRARAAVTF
jgi:outer membrane receptor protein involved in Fe transport